jgi:hypothetical protein
MHKRVSYLVFGARHHLNKRPQLEVVKHLKVALCFTPVKLGQVLSAAI